MVMDIRSILKLALTGILVMPSIAIAQESIPLGETIISSKKVDEKENFISKNEIDLNSNSAVPLLDIPSVSFKLGVLQNNKYEIKLNDTIIDDKAIGKIQLNKETNENIYTYYGVSLHEGKNEIIVNI